MGPLAAALLLFVQVMFWGKMVFPRAQSLLGLSGSFQSRKHAALKPTLLCPHPRAHVSGEHKRVSCLLFAGSAVSGSMMSKRSGP